MASIVWTPHADSVHCWQPTERKARFRPLPLRVRTYSVAGVTSPGADEYRDGMHARNKSTSSPLDMGHISPSVHARIATSLPALVTETGGRPQTPKDGGASRTGEGQIPSPPLTPASGSMDDFAPETGSTPEILPYDFSRIDYELERSKILGTGLWSTVYLAEPKLAAPEPTMQSTPPTTPRKRKAVSSPSLFAVKRASRKDAQGVFAQEARILSRLQGAAGANQHLVPFYGFDERNEALVFEAVVGGSLDNLAGRLKQMTEVARHVELIKIFPGIAVDLVRGLEFLHSAGVVHADIKSANVLLDMYEHYGHPQPVIRARYIDFSAAFMPAHGDSDAYAGGTWDFLAPEQLRITQKDMCTPTPASDVWSLGITLLSVIVGGSPYASACNGNVFLLREAVKSGDPLGFARMDPVPRKRLAACQDFVDCCRLALKKDRENRVTAGEWLQWLEDRQLGL